MPALRSVHVTSSLLTSRFVGFASILDNCKDNPDNELSRLLSIDNSDCIEIIKHANKFAYMQTLMCSHALGSAGIGIEKYFRKVAK